jgi:hypothetical protein
MSTPHLLARRKVRSVHHTYNPFNLSQIYLHPPPTPFSLCTRNIKKLTCSVITNRSIAAYGSGLQPYRGRVRLVRLVGRSRVLQAPAYCRRQDQTRGCIRHPCPASQCHRQLAHWPCTHNSYSGYLDSLVSHVTLFLFLNYRRLLWVESRKWGANEKFDVTLGIGC